MTKPDYSQFDALLIEAIKGGINRMAVLDLHKPLMDAAKPFCAASKSPYGTPEWRIIDRRLQALRKAGKIKHASQAWTIVE